MSLVLSLVDIVKMFNVSTFVVRYHNCCAPIVDAGINECSKWSTDNGFTLNS